MIGRSDACAALRAHRQKIRDLHLRTLFTEDPARGERLAVEAAGSGGASTSGAAPPPR
jgi:hypothetical protein